MVFGGGGVFRLLQGARGRVNCVESGGKRGKEKERVPPKAARAVPVREEIRKGAKYQSDRECRMLKVVFRIF